MKPTAAPRRRIEMYDTTLRDGTQGMGVSLSLADKLKIAQHLDALGFDYIEGGYPLSNPKDMAFFEQSRRMTWRHARVCAFGMTRRKGVRADADEGMKALLAARAPVVAIVGKTWDLHVEQVLAASLEENLAMIRESLAFCRGAGREVFYDAEHYFDGYRANPDYALATLRAAVEGGAARVILCDTNGGSLPGLVAQATAAAAAALGPDVLLGIHPHNDGGLAVANALAAVEAGARQVQGTINGIGERCGNVDLTTVAANLTLKLGCDCLHGRALAGLTNLSRFVYEVANLNLPAGQPYVGSAAFAHKGGMHVHAVRKLARSYEHVDPQSVGNTRRILVSELSGVSNVAAALAGKLAAAGDRAVQRKLVDKVAALEHQGYQFESAAASFELLAHEVLGTRPRYWAMDHYRCVILKREGEAPVTEATVKLRVGGVMEHEVAEGDGPVNALDGALRKCLRRHYPQLAQVHLRDYKVRVVNATAESAAKVRVVVDFGLRPATDDASVGAAPVGEAPTDAQAAAAGYFSTLGVSENIVDASWQALADAFAYRLIECGVKGEGTQPSSAAAT